jgi:hypothetical protein
MLSTRGDQVAGSGSESVHTQQPPSSTSERSPTWTGDLELALHDVRLVLGDRVVEDATVVISAGRVVDIGQRCPRPTGAVAPAHGRRRPTGATGRDADPVLGERSGGIDPAPRRHGNIEDRGRRPVRRSRVRRVADGAAARRGSPRRIGHVGPADRGRTGHVRSGGDRRPRRSRTHRARRAGRRGARLLRRLGAHRAPGRRAASGAMHADVGVVVDTVDVDPAVVVGARRAR